MGDEQSLTAVVPSTTTGQKEGCDHYKTWGSGRRFLGVERHQCGELQ